MKIVLTGGGTAGHIMPCVALIEQLKNDHELHYIGSENGMEKDIISNISGVKYHSVTVVKLVRSLTAKNLAIPFKLLKGIKQAKVILDEIKPDVVFSKGGFVALPAAKAAKCPLVCHESDLTMGLSNKLVKNKAAYFCSSFPEVASGLKNGVFTGSPVRKSLYRAKQFTVKPVLLIMGGSLGAKAINDSIADSIDRLTKKFDVIHITGKGKKTNIKADGYTQIEFAADIGELYSKAAVAVSRGGGSALFELAALKIPSVIIPLPKGVSRGDQVDNAEYFRGRGLCHVLDEKDLTADSLVKSVNAAYGDNEMISALKTAENIDGTDKIAKLILKAGTKEF